MGLSIETEKAMIQSVRSGDPRAFEVLYESHSKYVYRRCFRLTRDSRIAEDLTQDIFIQAWKKLSTFRGDCSFKTWLHRITTNILGMYFRRSQRLARLEQCCMAPEEGPSLEELLPSRGEHPDEKLMLCEIMSALTPDYRAILILHDVKGYKHDEIAEILGVPSGTSKSSLHRARLQLRKVLAGDEPAAKARDSSRPRAA
jgi:RNA polymerase sigma-70 factor, ECF subfamily